VHFTLQRKDTSWSRAFYHCANHISIAIIDNKKFYKFFYILIHIPIFRRANGSI
jgi:hypothetical protein